MSSLCVALLLTSSSLPRRCFLRALPGRIPSQDDTCRAPDGYDSPLIVDLDVFPSLRPCWEEIFVMVHSLTRSITLFYPLIHSPTHLPTHSLTQARSIHSYVTCIRCVLSASFRKHIILRTRTLVSGWEGASPRSAAVSSVVRSSSGSSSRGGGTGQV